MKGFLAQACDAARARVAGATTPLGELRDRPVPAPPGFAAALVQPGVSLIAEVKRASPSKGDIAPIPDAAALAADYAAGGAAAVSVLTEPQWFKGSLDDLSVVRAAVAVPLLRKDFFVDAYQIWEARAAGASAILLIVAALEPAVLRSLLRETQAAGLDALVETHAGDEVRAAVAAHREAGVSSPLIVGVNARDLNTLKVDPDRFAALRDLLPDDAIAVAESGITGPEQVAALAGLGADAVLVGEHLALADDPRAATAVLVAAGTPTPASIPRGGGNG